MPYEKTSIPSRWGTWLEIGTGVPAGSTGGYAPGCIFIDADAAQGSQLWLNEGTRAASDFNKIATCEASNAFSGVTNTFAQDAGTISGEEHGVGITSTGTLSSGDSLVGLNVVTTCAGSAASWVAGLFVNATQASKMVNGYICAAEFELKSTAAGASAHACLVLNMWNNHTGSVPVSPYIMLREYGTTKADCFVRIYNDTGQSGTTDATTLITTVSDNYEGYCNYAVRCMLGSTPIWLLATSQAAA